MTTNVKNDEMEDLLGTGTVLKQVLNAGDKPEDADMEAPRKFFALIDIDTRLADRPEDPVIESESHKDFLLSVDADLFSGAHLVLPLMNIGETARFILDSKFCYGSLGNAPHIPPDSNLECIITLKSRVPHDEFIENHLNDDQLFSLAERLALSNRKRLRGNFWFARSDYQTAITAYKSAKLLIKDAVEEDECVQLIGKNPSLFTLKGDGSNGSNSGKGEGDNCEIADNDNMKLDIIKCLVAIRNNLSQCYIKLQELSKALKSVDKILKLDPKNIKALFRRALIESQSGQSRDAQKTLQLILTIDPGNKSASAMLVQVKEKARLESERERGMYQRMFPSW